MSLRPDDIGSTGNRHREDFAMKKYIFALAIAAVASMALIVFAVPAMAGNGATIKDMSTTPAHGIPGKSGYNFDFWNGNGDMQDFAPTYYKGVATPSGVHNQVLKGIVANDTGAPVTYSANSGGPIPAGQECWNFDTGELSTDWSIRSRRTATTP
jgi:hypothetical protein